MELLKLSKFKLKLRALISEVRELKEKERSSSQHLELTIQKQKVIEEEYNRKLEELRAELALSHELKHELERKVSSLENDNDLLENKQNELKGTIHSLLESREAFLKAYEDSTYEMKRAIEDRDRKNDLLSEKIKSHLLLFDSISTEASSINQLLHDTRHALNQKEDVVAGLKRKMDEVSTFEKLFIEKINNLESKLRNNEMELTMKTKRNLELEAELEAAILSKEFQPKIIQLQRDVSTKELLLQNLISENKGLRSEVVSLGIAMHKIQGAVTRMSEEDRNIFTSLLEDREGDFSVRQSETLRMADTVQMEDSHLKTSMIEESTASPEFQEQIIKSSLNKDNKLQSNVSESLHSPSRSACSGPEFEADDTNVSPAEAKDYCTYSVNQPDSECSTTQVEM